MNHDYGIKAVFKHMWERSRGSFSMMIVYVCVILFVVVATINLLGIVSKDATFSFLGLSYLGIFQRFWIHQFLTAPFLHGGIGHLIFNMLALWMLGPEVEKTLGRNRYIHFSILCAGSSMIGYLLFNWGTGSIVVGYSGVIFGILVAQAMFFPNNIIHFFAFFPLKMKYAVLIMAAIELYLTVTSNDSGIANVAHLFGALAALLYIKNYKWFANIVSDKNRKPVVGIGLKPRRSKKRKNIPREL